MTLSDQITCSQTFNDYHATIHQRLDDQIVRRLQW